MSWKPVDLKELGHELDTLREIKEDIDSGETTAEESVDWDEERFSALEHLENAIGDLHLASREMTLISDDDWEEYCQEKAEELFLVGGDKCPLIGHIDWEGWADAMRSDYTEVGVGDDTYYYQET